MHFHSYCQKYWTTTNHTIKGFKKIHDRQIDLIKGLLSPMEQYATNQNLAAKLAIAERHVAWLQAVNHHQPIKKNIDTHS